MKYANYHTHSKWCDGKGSPEKYVIEAIANKMYALGFSIHSPVPFKSDWNAKYENLMFYLSEIQLLKDKYKSEIRIYSGMEVDFIEAIVGPSSYKHLGLDYTIGGVHFLKKFNEKEYFDFDASPEKFQRGINEIFNGDIKLMVEFYYEQVIKMLETDPPEIISHLDLIMKFNKDKRFFDSSEKWYKDLVLKTLDIISKTNCVLEINSRSLMKGLLPEFHPENWIVKQSKEFNIPFILSADAHKPHEVNSLLKEESELLKTYGYKEIMIFDENGFNISKLQNLNR